MSGVVAGKTVAAAPPRQFRLDLFPLRNVVEGKPEAACLGAVHQHHRGAVHAAQDGGQGTQVEALIDRNTAAGKAWREVELAPESLLRTGKNRLSPRLVAVQLLGDFQDAVQVGARAL